MRADSAIVLTFHVAILVRFFMLNVVAVIRPILITSLRFLLIIWFSVLRVISPYYLQLLVGLPPLDSSCALGEDMGGARMVGGVSILLGVTKEI